MISKFSSNKLAEQGVREYHFYIMLYRYLGFCVVIVVFLASFPLKATQRYIFTPEVSEFTETRLKKDESRVLISQDEKILPIKLGKLVTFSYSHDFLHTWLKLFASNAVLKERGPYDLVLWQRFASFWPFKDREFVYNYQGSSDKEQKIFTTSINSVLWPQAPLHDCCLRAEFKGSTLTFKVVDREHTLVKVWLAIDLKGHLPHFLASWLYDDAASKLLQKLAANAWEIAKLPEDVNFTDWY